MEDRVWVQQSNGSYYCYLRKRVWENGNAKVIEKKLLGKSDVKGGELKPTRKKRPAGTGNALIANNTESSRPRVGRLSTTGIPDGPLPGAVDSFRFP